MTIIEVRPGEGGADAAAFANELTDSITSYLRRLGARPPVRGDVAGRTIILSVCVAPELVEWLSGTHRVQRIPSRASARHTSTATIVVLGDEPDERKSWVEQSEVRIDRYRGGGPGGQHKNKVSTAIRVVHEPSGTIVTRESGRSQKENLRSALDDLDQRLGAQERGRRKSVRESARRQQVQPERAAKSFTHNEQRSEVVDHATGRRWTMKAWAQGRLN